MKNLKNLIDITKKIPSLKVEEIKVDKEYQFEKVFEERMLQPKTGQRISENIVEFPVWDDTEIFGDMIPPWGFHKYSAYEVTSLGLGLVKITFRWGKRVRKTSDYRFFDEKDVTTVDYYFMYNNTLSRYQEVTPEKSKEWQERVKGIEIFEKEAVSFVYKFLTKTWKGFLGLNNRFKLSYKINYGEISNHLDIIDRFLEEYLIYSDILLVAYSDITNNEHQALQDAIHQQKSLNQNARIYMSKFTYNSFFDVTKDFHDRTNINEPFGPITTPIEGIKSLLTPRQEKIDEDSWFVYNVCRGYLTMNRSNNELLPNPAEIERRRGLYHYPFNEQTENELIKEIKKRFR